MTRWKRVVVLCVVGLLMMPDRPAEAFWKKIGKLSGPGPFYGVDFVYPFSLSPPSVESVQMNNKNLRMLSVLGVQSVHLSETCDEFLRNAAQHDFLRRELKAQLPASPRLEPGQGCGRAQDDPAVEVFLTSFVSTFPTARQTDAAPQRMLKPSEHLLPVDERKPPPKEPKTPKEPKEPTEPRRQPTQPPDVVASLNVANEKALDRLNEQLRRSTRRFGAGPGGVLGGFEPIPDLADKPNRLGSRFFTLSLGVAFAARNDLPYADSFEGAKDVVWLSMFPAFDQRVRLGRVNPFVQVGLAGHYFLGAHFDDFARLSARGRVGAEVYGIAYVGVEVDYFFKAFRPQDFGAIPDDRDLDRWTVAFFFGLDLSGAGRH